MFAASGLFLVLLLLFGIPAVFKLTSFILNARTQTTTQSDPAYTPNTPRISQEYEATNSAELKITGAADAKTIIELFQNNNSLGTKVSQDNGNFQFEITLHNGENAFTVQAISTAGKKSSLSPIYRVFYLTKPPKLEFMDFKDSLEVKETPYILQGTTDPLTTVTANDRLIFVDRDGNFKYNLNLNSGENKIIMIAKDKAGNETKKEIIIKYSP